MWQETQQTLEVLQGWEEIELTFKQLTIYFERLKDTRIIMYHLKITSPALDLKADPETMSFIDGGFLRKNLWRRGKEDQETERAKQGCGLG